MCNFILESDIDRTLIYKGDQLADCELCEAAGYWQEHKRAVIHVETKHPRHAQRVTCPLSIQAELGGFQL